MFENPRRGRQTRNFTTNVQKILDLKSPSEQIFSENCLWVPLLRINLQINLAVADLLIGFTEPVTIGTYGILLFYSDLAENTQYGNVSTAFQAMFAATSVRRLPRSHFLGTSVYIDLPISTSSDNHSILYPQYYFCVVYRNNFGYILFARCKWNSGFYPLDSRLAYCCISARCLLTICVTSLIVRRKVNTCRQDPAMVKNHSKNRPNDEKHI